MDSISKEALSVLAYLYLEHFKYEKALRLLRVLKKYHPDDAEIGRSLAYAYLKNGDYDRALQEAERSGKNAERPEHKMASGLIKAKALWGLGKEEAARQAFTQVVEKVKLPKPEPKKEPEEPMEEDF